MTWRRQVAAGLWLALRDASQTARSAERARTSRGEAARALTTDADCERFIQSHQHTILNYLWRMTGDEQAALDLAQEVFVRAWQHFDTIRAYEQPRGWLLRVATNLALTHLKRRAAPVHSAAPLDDESDESDERGLASGDPAWRVAESDHVRRTLLQLSPKRRAALVLREVYGLTGAETGQTLGISETAVRMTLHRAREQFRELYMRDGGTADGS